MIAPHYKPHCIFFAAAEELSWEGRERKGKTSSLQWMIDVDLDILQIVHFNKIFLVLFCKLFTSTYFFGTVEARKVIITNARNNSMKNVSHSLQYFLQGTNSCSLQHIYDCEEWYLFTLIFFTTVMKNNSCSLQYSCSLWYLLCYSRNRKGSHHQWKNQQWLTSFLQGTIVSNDICSLLYFCREQQLHFNI